MANKVTELYAWVIEDDDGDECVLSAYRLEPDGTVVPSPMMGADLAHLTKARSPGGISARDIARKNAQAHKKSVRLVRCSKAETVEVIEP